MITIRTNRPEYRNDIAEEIRLFLGLTEIALFEEADTEKIERIFDIQLNCADGQYTLYASAGKTAYADSFSVPINATPLEIKRVEKRRIKLACYDLLKQLYPEVSTPWGSLTGIRPTKLFRELTNKNGVDFARQTFLETFGVSEEKITLAENICSVQSPHIDTVRGNDVDVYVGIPFCKTKCLYCSFASEVLKDSDRPTRYLDVLKQDIACGARICKERGFLVRSFYMGGGTPTVLSAGQLDELLTYILEQYGSFGMECTVEAGRPDTIDEEKLKTLKRLGITRVSINPQTMNDATLLRVGRTHTAQDVKNAFALAREIGFDVINMDLIAGLPGETTDDMQSSCDEIRKLEPDNLTVHSLAIKRSSRLKLELSDYAMADAAMASRMTEIGAECADALGMRPYYMYRQKYMSGNLENVGYALPGKECAYNIDMMEETASILAHGAGTMTKRVFGDENRIERLPSPKDVPTYLNKLDRLCMDKELFFGR
jgi:oxygen-independent coproporphyrinogen-3 oxidase